MKLVGLQFSDADFKKGGLDGINNIENYLKEIKKKKNNSLRNEFDVAVDMQSNSS